MGELAVLLTRFPNQLRVYVLFLRPEGADASWVRSSLWSDAARIPGVFVVEDPEGVEAARFGATASGQTFLYDQQGVLRFSGGITAARGHSGDNAGRSAIASLLRSGTAGREKTPAFGCALFSEEIR